MLLFQRFMTERFRIFRSYLLCYLNLFLIPNGNGTPSLRTVCGCGSLVEPTISYLNYQNCADSVWDEYPSDIVFPTTRICLKCSAAASCLVADSGLSAVCGRIRIQHYFAKCDHWLGRHSGCSIPKEATLRKTWLDVLNFYFFPEPFRLECWQPDSKYE